MRVIVSTLLCGLLLFTFAACSKTEQANNNTTTANPSSSASPATKILPENIVTASVAETQLPVPGSAEATVLVNVMSGYHINANPATGKYQIATQLTVAKNADIDVGQPQYPQALTRKFSFSPEPLAVYEGQVPIKVTLGRSAGKNALPQSQTLRATLRVQPCDDQACYPPRNIEVSIPVAFKQ